MPGFWLAGFLAVWPPAQPATQAADDKPAAHARIADLAVLREDYVDRSRSFTPESRRRAIEYLDALRSRADGLTDAQFLVAIARTTALADNGHDSWHSGDGAWLAKRAPVRFFWFPDALLVVRAAPEARELLGARVTAIDGHNVGELFERLRPLCGGTEDYRRWNLALYLERAELLHAVGLSTSPDRSTLSLVLRDGRAITRDIAMLPRESTLPGEVPGRLLSGPSHVGESRFGWGGVPLPAEAPLYLQEPDRLFRIEEMPSIGASYLQFRSHLGTGTESIEDFLRVARAHLAERKPEHLIVDLRFDGGGNIDPTVDFFNGLAGAVPGRIYVIVSRLTFSAGIVAAALIEQSAPERVTIVGEPVGDRLRFWSEGRTVCLPESKVCLRASDGLWDLVSGCAQEPGCYGDAYRVKVPDLDPDLAAPLTADSWLDGMDPAMTAIEAHLWSCHSCEPEPGVVD